MFDFDGAKLVIYFGICKLFLEFVLIFWWKGVERDEKGVKGV